MKAAMKPTHEEIAFYSYLIWENEGRPCGRAFDHWLQAEAQLKAEQKNKMSALLETKSLRSLAAPLNLVQNKKRTAPAKPKQPTSRKKAIPSYVEPVFA